LHAWRCCKALIASDDFDDIASHHEKVATGILASLAKTLSPSLGSTTAELRQLKNYPTGTDLVNAPQRGIAFPVFR